MTYDEFVRRVEIGRFTLPQVRFDVPPTEDLMVLLGDVGSLEVFERHVNRYETNSAEEERRTNAADRASSIRYGF